MHGLTRLASRIHTIDEEGDAPSEVRHVLKESEFVEALNDFIDEKATYQPLIVPKTVKARAEGGTNVSALRGVIFLRLEAASEETESPAPVVGDKFGNTTTGSQSDRYDTPIESLNVVIPYSC